MMVDVWISDLNELSLGTRHFRSLLTPEERLRADRYLQPVKKERFVLNRGMLKSVLSRYLDISPENVPLTYGEQGKPKVGQRGRKLHFNLSHSRNISVLAVSKCSRVGIDVEVMDKDPARLDRIIDFVCSPGEKEHYFAMSAQERFLLAYRLWTANEAYGKGIGTGMQRVENKLAFHLGGDCEPRIHAEQRDLDPAWRFRHFSPVPDSIATIAVEAGDSVFDVNLMYLN